MLTSLFLKECISRLEDSNLNPREWAELYCKLKIEFFRKYQHGMVFSTRFGGTFFTEAYQWMQRNDFLKAEPGEVLGDYDKNFNAWLKIVRSEKGS